MIRVAVRPAFRLRSLSIRVSSLLVLAGAWLSLGAAPARATLAVHWMSGFRAPGTPARFDKVGVIKVGPRSARNVLVLEPGTSAGAGYFVPLRSCSTTTWASWPQAPAAGRTFR